MEEITFIYKNIKTKIKYNYNEIMGDIFKKCADQLKKNIDEINFKYNNKLINKNLKIKDIIKDKKSGINIIYIFVYDIVKKNEEEKISKEENSHLDNQKNETANICNYIIGEFEIKDINKKTRILNSFESWDNEIKAKTETFRFKNEYEIKNIIELKINDNKIPFSYFYNFRKPGKYIIKYILKNLLTKTVCLFADCTLLKKVDLSNFNTEKVDNMNSMFTGCKLLNDINLTDLNTKNVIDMGCMFYECESLKNLDLSKFNTENVTNMCGMFYGCKSLKNLVLSKFNTENVTNMNCMFYGCKSLKNLDVSKFNTENVTNMKEMFYGCESLEILDVSKFNTENVTNMREMFSECKSLKNLDLSKFNTKNVKEMQKMFSGCKSLKDINKINFIRTKGAYFGNMFDGCNSFPYTSIIYSNFYNEKNNTIDNNDINNIISKLKRKENIIEYNNKIDYKFIKRPNLKYKLKTNFRGRIKNFEIFTSYIDNTDYIAFPDYSDSNLKIFYFYENKLKKNIKIGDSIKEIRYFINKNNYNEYLLIKRNKKVNILYITNNYINIYEHDEDYYDCLLVFPSINAIYFVFSEHEFYSNGYYSDEIEYYEYSRTRAYVLFDYKSILYSEVETDENSFLLLSWYNKKNNLYYIIQLRRFEQYINIYELLSTKKTYCLKCPPDLIDGIVTCNNDANQTDYLNVLTKSNNIYIYNLENGNILKKYDIFNNFKQIGKIGQFIQWNDRYIIFIIDNYFLKILDLKINKIITVIKTNHDICFIKKINHQIYGESLLISGNSYSDIYLWTI